MGKFWDIIRIVGFVLPWVVGKLGKRNRCAGKPPCEKPECPNRKAEETT